MMVLTQSHKKSIKGAQNLLNSILSHKTIILHFKLQERDRINIFFSILFGNEQKNSNGSNSIAENVEIHRTKSEDQYTYRTKQQFSTSRKLKLTVKTIEFGFLENKSLCCNTLLQYHKNRLYRTRLPMRRNENGKKHKSLKYKQIYYLYIYTHIIMYKTL